MPDEMNGDPDPANTEHASYARLLKAIDLFTGVDRVTLAKLAAHLQPVSYPPGATVFQQGEVGDAFYLIVTGSVGVYTSNERTGEALIKLLSTGEPFGEMALLSDIGRTASIRTHSECRFLRLDRVTFLGLVKEQPSVALAIADTLGRRLAAMLDSGGRPSVRSAPAAQQAADKIAPSPQRLRERFKATGRNFWRVWAALFAAAVVFALGWSVAAPAGLSLPGWHALIILLALLPALALDAVLEGILGILLACAWVLCGVTSASVALSGFASPNWILVVSILIIGAAITQTGVLYRLALKAITHMRGGFIGEATALACVGQLMGPAVPNATSRIIIIAPMLRELVDALGYGPKSPAAAGLAMAVLIGFGQLAATTLTSSTTSVLVAAVLPMPARGQINWITWTLYGAPYNIMLLVSLLAVILWRYRPRKKLDSVSSERMKSLALQTALLGPMSPDEKIAIGVGLGLLAGFVTQPLHRIDPGWIAAAAVAVMSACRVVNPGTLRAVNWNFALLFGSLISLATVFSHTGLDQWLTGRVASIMGDLGSSRVAFVGLLAVLCVAVSFVVRWQAAAPLVTIALAPVASAAGIHPYIVGLIAVVACNGFLLPYQSTTYLALDAGTGRALFTRQQTLATAIAYGAASIVAAILSIPFWKLMGLM